MRMLLRLEKTPLPVIVLPLPVPSSMTTPHGVEVSSSTNGEEGVEADVVLEGVQIQREVTFSLVKRKVTKRMTHLVILNQIRKTRKSPHSGAN